MMPGIFYKAAAQWCMAPIAASPSLLRLDACSVEPFATASPRSASHACLLVRVGRPNKWAALVAAHDAVRHNGMPVAAGLRILAHRDALAIDGGGPVFFTTEEPAHVETYAEAAPLVCPRCKRDVVQGDAVVRCPTCSVVHHERDDSRCWTYAPECAACYSHATALDAGLRWTPEDL